MRFTVDNTQGGQPSWWLHGDNNRTVAWARDVRKRVQRQTSRGELQVRCENRSL